MNEIKTQNVNYCHVESLEQNSTIIPAELNFMTGKMYMRTVSKYGKQFSLFNTITDIENMSCAQDHINFEMVALEYDEDDNKWHTIYFNSNSELWGYIMTNSVENKNRFLIPYFTIAQDVINDFPKRFTTGENTYPALEQYNWVGDDYKTINFDEFIDMFTINSDTNNYDNTLVYVNIDQKSMKTYITPASLYTFNSDCEPQLLKSKNVDNDGTTTATSTVCSNELADELADECITPIIKSPFEYVGVNDIINNISINELQNTIFDAATIEIIKSFIGKDETNELLSTYSKQIITKLLNYLTNKGYIFVKEIE